ncbi:uncharacterized protein LOC135714089 [Ochlerotatus camptorhynchus]|uniref:uncharacterized protein LOC135714089 n=1 Tax=Ochlerotatus camptorhynchus TaxID=644619 RepID=UPI0031DFD8E3
MATEVQTQRRLLNVEASLPSTAATTPKLGVSQPSVSPLPTSLVTPANKPASAPSIPNDSCDLSFLSDTARDATITPDHNPNPAMKVDISLPIFLTPKTNKRLLSELDHSRRPPRSAEVPKIPKPHENSPESPDKKDEPKKKRNVRIGTDKGRHSHSPKDIEEDTTSVGHTPTKQRNHLNFFSPVETSLPFCYRGSLSGADSTNGSADNPDEINISGYYDIRHSVNMSRESIDSATAFPKPALPKPVKFLLQWNLNGFFQHLADLELLCQGSLPWGSNFRHSVAIGVLREVAFHPIDVASDLPFIAVQLEGPLNITVACAYLPCGRLNGLNSRMKSAIEKLPEPRILVGDMNGHHSNWGCPKPNSRGSALADLFESEDLVVLNDGAPTFFNGRHATAIDVSALNRDVAGKMQWIANSDLYGSDHYPIKIQLHAAAAPETTRIPRWRYDKAEWEVYRNAILSGIQEQNPGNIPDLTKIILEAAVASVPKTSSIPRTKSSPMVSSADLWNRVNALSGKRRSAPLQVQSGGITVSEPTAVADELGKYFAELLAIPGYNENFRRRNNATPTSIGNFHVPTDNNNTGINGVFSWDELKFALSKSKGKSAGPDELGYPLLTHLPIEGQVLMLDLFNKLWTTDSYPASWRESLVIPIPKTNKTTKDTTKFRPIALTSCMSKVFERMVNRRLKTFLSNNNLLDHRQHAFRHGYGTSTYFATLGDVLKDAFDQGHHTEMVSLDISKAFNRTWTPAVLAKLVSWGLKGHMVHFVRNFLTNRAFRVAIGNAKSRSFQEETGVLQGSVISVTLFLIAMNGIFSQLPKNVRIFVYADDVLIVVTGPTTTRTRNLTQAAVTAVVKWAEAAGYQLSARKSIRCHVCPSRHRVNGTAIKIGDQAIPVKNSIRILGVLVDRTLSFVPHFNQVKKDCRSRVNLIRTISRPHRTNNRAVRFRVAQAIIDSRLLYGTELTCINSEKQVEILGPTFNSSIRIIPAPADSACVEAGVLPFRYRIINATIFKAASFAAKTAGNGRIFLLDEGDRILQTIATIDLPPVARTHWHGEKRDNSAALRRTVAEHIRTHYAEHTHRYSDGSRSNTGVGIGVSGSGILASNSLPPQCSVYSAEAAAIFHAATLPANQPILILIDSCSAIQELCSATPTHPWIQATIKYAPVTAEYPETRQPINSLELDRRVPDSRIKFHSKMSDDG